MIKIGSVAAQSSVVQMRKWRYVHEKCLGVFFPNNTRYPKKLSDVIQLGIFDEWIHRG